MGGARLGHVAAAQQDRVAGRPIDAAARCVDEPPDAGGRRADAALRRADVGDQAGEPVGAGVAECPQCDQDTSEQVVATRKDWTPEQVLADYEEISEKGIAAAAGFQDGPAAETGE